MLVYNCILKYNLKIFIITQLEYWFTEDLTWEILSEVLGIHFLL